MTNKLIKDGYYLKSQSEQYVLTPDDGTCTLCNTDGPIYHIFDKDFWKTNNTMSGGYRTDHHLLDICKDCCEQISSMFEMDYDTSKL